MNIKRSNLASLIERRILAANSIDLVPDIQYSPERGFHIYAKVNLLLALSASETDISAKRYLQVIQAFAEIVDQSAIIVGAAILEVQGDVIHLLFRCDHDVGSVIRLLRFSIALNKAVNQAVKPLAGDSWRSFVMAAEHGEAVLLINGHASSDSVVSLGPAANNPAKQIPATSAGALSIRPDSLAMVYSDVDKRASWVEFNLDDPPVMSSTNQLTSLQAFVVNEATILNRAEGIRKNANAYQPLIRTFNARDITEDFETTVTDPYKVQGFVMRADLDGFTADVEQAFADKTGTAVAIIVNRFTRFMAFANSFADRSRWPIIRIPWAGDCANMILLPRDGFTYAYERKALPVVEPARWHDLSDEVDDSGQRWKEYFLESDWVVSAAGGNDSEGSSGFLLVANVIVSSRRFKIVAGWGAARSHDALEKDGVRAKDTVLHNADYTGLETRYREVFERIGASDYYRANGLSLRRITKVEVSKESTRASAIVTATGVLIPAPKPYWRS